MRIAVIDDEKPSRDELVYLIRQCCPNAEISEASSGEGGLNLISRQQFDFLFVDIHLGDLQGTTLAEIARRLMPNAKIIFATAYPEYAVKAFELGVDNYILKPFDPARIRTILQGSETPKAEKKKATAETGRIAITCNRHTVLLNISDIVYVETRGTGHQCVLHMKDQSVYNVSDTLNRFEECLHSEGFYRIHRTCIVQLACIQDIFPWSSGAYALHMQGCNSVLPIGRERLRGLRESLHIKVLK